MSRPLPQAHRRLCAVLNLSGLHMILNRYGITPGLACNFAARVIG